MNHRARIDAVITNIDELLIKRPDLAERLMLIKMTLEIADVTPADVTRVGAYVDNLLGATA